MDLFILLPLGISQINELFYFVHAPHLLPYHAELTPYLRTNKNKI